MAEERRATPLRIMLAEDSPANIHLYKTILEANGHRVSVAEHGVAAVEMAGAEPFDLILMDLGLPRLTGLEASTRIRDAGVTTLIFALTADDEPSLRRACREHGLDGFLTKPIGPSDLIRAVEGAVSGAVSDEAGGGVRT